ncbi:carboxyl transferase domain-containing protein [Streptomyces sp. NPDC004549]|uniref:acetyl-CoA carboxylase family protein n=1 Tax=Streptomyces sp. NPDC004549 TaxID=3154283 RepID=UPI0033BD9F6B
MPEASTVLVANRGEIAVRVIRAVHDRGGKAIAVHPADDAESLHVRRADEAVQIPGVGTAAYLDIDAIVRAATESGANAIHPGYGFLSENTEFARRCAEAGLLFVGPTPDVLDLFGDKARARAYALACDVPVLPGTSEATTLAEAEAFAAEHGAVMIKALAGGGGRGMRAVTDPAALAGAYEEASGEALRSFGEGAVYVEKLLTRPRHIEVQILGDGTGAVVALGERDCSIQRRHQKLVEVAPSPWLGDGLRRAIVAAARRLAEGVSYSGLGTFEFLVGDEEFWFMEANPRVQVEHTVTEEVTGVDLVSAQLAVAGGATLADLGLTEAPRTRGVAVQVRVNAETLGGDGTPVPSAGVLRRYEMPTGPGVRVDTYGYRGYRTSPRYDSLLAKVVVQGADLSQACARTVAALEELVIDGVATNADLLHGIVSSSAFRSAPWDTGFIADHIDHLLRHARPSGGEEEHAEQEESHGAVEVPPGSVAVVAPAPGVVLRLDAIPGDVVGAGRTVAVIEAMKMETVLRADAGMRVESVTARVGDVVEAGTVLAHGVPADSAATVATDALDDDGDWSAEIAEIERRRDAARHMGGAAKVTRQHDQGKFDARQRVDALADAGTFTEIGALTGFTPRDDRSGSPEFTPANFVAGTARLDGRKVVLGVDDFTLRGGSGDAAIHDKQIFAERYANEMRLPVVRLLDGASGGGSVKMATDAGYTYVPVNPGWDAVVDNLSLVPVVSAGLGPVVGLGAARMVMSHLSILVDGIGQMFTAGPPVVLGGTGERLTKEELGGSAVHRANGSIERVVPDEQAAFDAIRRFLSYLPSSVFELPPVTASQDPADRRDEALLGAVPRNSRRVYDVTTILDAVFDAGSVFRYAEYGGGTLTALARLDGHPVGVIAADPEQGATMSAEGALAVTRLVDLCETFHLPLVSLTDQAGMTIGSAAERAATIRHGARAITAVYQARVPQTELIVRRVFGVGGAGIINRHRASRSWAWPSGTWGSLPSKGGIEAAFRAQIEAADDPARELERLVAEVESVTSPFRTAERFGVQDIIDPRESRPLLCDWVRDAYRLLPEHLGRPSFGTRP